MILGGVQKVTLIDFPGKIAATAFTSGCFFRCPWCYSPELVLPEKIKSHPKISEKDFFRFLNERKGLIEGVVICGGEPCLQKDLPQFCGKIKKLGFAVKLDTNGFNPPMLKSLIDKNLLDYVAMDIKAPKEKYEKAAGKKININNIEKSVKILKEGGVDFEFRTTVIPGIHTKEDIIEIAKWIKPAPRYFLQNFRPEKTLDPRFLDIKPYPQEFLLEIQKILNPFFDVCQVR